MKLEQLAGNEALKRQLSAQAKALELAGKGGDVDYIQENHPALLRGYVELCAYIDGI